MRLPLSHWLDSQGLRGRFRHIQPQTSERVKVHPTVGKSKYGSVVNATG